MFKKIEKVLNDMAYDYECFESVEFANGVKLRNSLKVKDMFIEVEEYENIEVWSLEGKHLFTIRKKSFYQMMFELGWICGNC